MENTNKPVSIPVLHIEPKNDTTDGICYYFESYEQYLLAIEDRNKTGVLEGWKFKAPCKLSEGLSIENYSVKDFALTNNSNDTELFELIIPNDTEKEGVTQ